MDPVFRYAARHSARASRSEDVKVKAPVEMKEITTMIEEKRDDRKLGKVDHRTPSPAPVKAAAPPSSPARPTRPPSERIQRSGDQLRSRLYSRLGVV